MLTFASPSTSSDNFPMLAHFAKPFNCYDDKKMFVSNCFSDDDSSFADDSGFFDDFESSNISYIGHEIGTKLAAMCDDFDNEMYDSRTESCSKASLLDRFLNFFTF